MSLKFALFCLLLTLTLFTAGSGVEGQENSLAGHEVVRGVLRNHVWWHLGEERTFYTFRPFKNTTIDTRTYEIESERGDKVTAITAWEIKTIRYLPVNVAEAFPNLILYRFWYCPITEIKKENFKNMANLEYLDLEATEISSIDKDVFEDLHALKWLSLNQNRLTSLHEYAFVNNRELQVLHLDYNHLESLPSKLLQNLSELKRIHVIWNKLSTLDERIFADNVNLEEIKLSSNKIKHLNASTFAGLVKLEYVGLDGNKCISKKYGKDWETTFEDLSKLSSDLAQNCSQRRG